MELWQSNQTNTSSVLNPDYPDKSNQSASQIGQLSGKLVGRQPRQQRDEQAIERCQDVVQLRFIKLLMKNAPKSTQ